MQDQKQKDFIASCDIGTTKICVVIAKKDSNGQLEIIGFGEENSNGLKKGVIVNIDNTVKSIKKAVEAAEMMAGVEVEYLTVGIAGGQVNGINSNAVIGRNRADKEISEEDVERVVHSAQTISIPSDREIIHVIPQEFSVDDQDGILNPVGMSGVRLKTDVHLVTCSKTATQNIHRSVERAGYKVEDIVLQPIASAEAILNDDEKELGAIVIDIGGGTTDIIFYINNSIYHTYVIPIGGDLVTKDISFGLRTPKISAELIKKQYGNTLPDRIDSDDYFSVPLVGGNEPTNISSKMLAEIIHPRMAELFNLIGEEIERTGYRSKIAAGIILTGGASQMEGILELSEQHLNYPCRLGKPYEISGLSESVDNPKYSTAVGLAKFSFDGHENYSAEFKNQKAEKSIIDKTSQWLKDFFR